MRRLLRWLTNAPLADAVWGDLQEQYNQRRARSRVAAGVWLLIATGAIATYFAGRWIRQPVTRPARLLGGLRSDLTHAWRRLRREPTPFFVATVSLGLALGVAASVFSNLNGRFVREYLAADPDVVLAWRVHGNGSGASRNWPLEEFEELQRRARTVRLEIELLTDLSVSRSSSADSSGAVHEVAFASGGYLDEFRASAALGRLLGPEDDRPGAPPVAVLEYLFWRRQLEGTPHILGEMIYVDGVPFRVVGVAGRDFVDPNRVNPAIWTPLASIDHVPHVLEAVGDTRRFAVGKLADGVGEQEAEAELTQLVTRLPSGALGDTPPATGVDLGPAIAEEQVATLRLTITVVMSVLALVLLLAAINVANLLLASATTRHRELGVRLALGASRRQLARLLVTESLVIAAAAGGAGLLCAIWVAPVLGVLMGWPGADVDPDARVFAFLSIATVLCGLGAGLVPARAGVRGDVTACLKGHRGATAGAIRPGRMRSMLIVAQTAASVILVVLAALLVRALADVAWQDPGYDPERLVTVFASTPGASRDDVDEARAGAYWMTALDRVRALPGVESAALGAYPPFGFTFGVPSDEPFVNYTDAAYFDVIGARLVRGRYYTDAEVRAGEPVAVVSESVVRRFWGVDDPLGDGLARVNERLSRHLVIGVVADAMVFGLDHRGKPLIHLPHSTFRRTSMVVRTSAPAATAPVVTQALAAIAPDSRPRALVVSERFDRDFQAPRRMAAVSTAVAALALAIAAVGLYGVTSFVVGRRRHEIGVRMAIGARAGGVVRLLVRDGMRPVLIGMVLGVAAALAAGRLLASLMYGVSVRDPIALIAAVFVLLVVTLVAVAVPAARAARTDPALVLRADGGG